MQEDQQNRFEFLSDQIDQAAEFNNLQHLNLILDRLEDDLESGILDEIDVLKLINQIKKAIETILSSYPLIIKLFIKYILYRNWRKNNG